MRSRPRLRSLCCPASALADDGQSVYRVQAAEQGGGRAAESSSGFDLGDGLDQSQPGFVKATIVVTTEREGAARGAGLSGRRHDPDAGRRRPRCAPSARRRSTPRRAAKAALKSSAASKSKSAAAGTVRAQHADYWEDAGGRWLSIEGTTTQAAVDLHAPRSLQRPAARRGLDDASGSRSAAGNLSALLDPDVTPRRVPVPRHHASAWATPRRSARRCRRSSASRPRTATSRTLAVKKWVGNGAPQYAAGFQTGLHHPLRGPAGGLRARSRRSPASSRTSRRSPTCRTRRRATSASRRRCSASRRPTPARPRPRPRPSRPRAVVLTSKAWGQEGGNDLTAQIVNPGANNAPLSGHASTGNAITVHAATDATGAVTSTAAQVVAAINANAAAATLVTASLYRTNTGAGVVTAQAAPSKLSDWLNAPASYPRGPQTVKMLRIGNDVGEPQGSKVGVFIYCQEHAREWGTPLVCLETAERLLRNYAHRSRDEEPRRRPRHLHRPDDQRRRRRVLDVRLQLAAQEHGQLLRVEPDGQQRPVRPQHLGRRPQPQLLGRLGLRRLRRRAATNCTERHVPGPVGVLRARDPQRGVHPVDVLEHQVRDERALLRRLLHVAPGRLQARRARRCPTRRTAR